MVSYRDTDGYTTHTKPIFDEWAARALCLKTFTVSIKKVIFNDPATIVFWSDGTKTVVKCADFDIFDPVKGLAMAICKRIYGKRFHSVFKEFLPEEDVESAYPAGPKIPIPAWFNGLVKEADNITISINTNAKEDK